MPSTHFLSMSGVSLLSCISQRYSDPARPVNIPRVFLRDAVFPSVPPIVARALLPVFQQGLSASSGVPYASDMASSSVAALLTPGDGDTCHSLLRRGCR
ncbi:hypothetical protein LSAT2_004153 [Lamellibrachia satsuma]|nr:hypothetical protein LSAT2_004153 [Lamellibrachia satsuma]